MPLNPPESGRKRRTPPDDAATAPQGAGDAPAPSEAPSTTSLIDEPFKVQKERLIDAFERQYLRELMTWAGGNVSRAARKAKIDRMYLHRLLARHGIVREPSRASERT